MAVVVPRPAAVLPMQAKLPTVPESGDALVAQMLAEYRGWSAVETATLKMAGRQFDRARQLHDAIAEAEPAARSRLRREERAAMSSFIGLVRSLRLREEA